MPYQAGKHTRLVRIEVPYITGFLFGGRNKAERSICRHPISIHVTELYKEEELIFISFLGSVLKSDWKSIGDRVIERKTEPAPALSAIYPAQHISQHLKHRCRACGDKPPLTL